jgi:hypothetical protein
MRIAKMLTISSQNLSLAWAAAVAHIHDNAGKEISPLIVQVTGFQNGEPLESSDIRDYLDALLNHTNNLSVETVANTIFPNLMWRISRGDRHNLFKLYERVLPRFVKLEPDKNHRGLYFQRLIAYGRGPQDEGQLGRGPYNGNQLEYIIRSYTPSVVKMKLQASIFDPKHDLFPGARIGFPCLQHISLIPHNNYGLSLNAFYATQLLFKKAYGNFLGLCRLGNFMATQMGLTLTEFNCFIGSEKLDTTKSSLRDLVNSERSNIEASVKQLSV